jgi:hypothetical protein
MATSFKGGWKNPLLTVNLMEDPLPQPSLTQGLRLGVGKAHRQQIHGGSEFRNFRRSIPLGNRARVGK